MSTKPLTSSAAKRPYFAALDGFRGLLAVIVAMYHTIWMSHPNSWAFFNNGPVIIDLFFAFSGFLMFTLYRDQLATRAQVRTFLTRRLARLYPLHVFMLLVFLGFALLRLWAHKVGLASVEPGEILPFEAGAPENWRSLFAHLTMTHAMGGADSLTFNPPSWTIGAEVYTYFVFIAFMVILAGRKLLAAPILGLALFVAVLYGGLAALRPNMDITYDLGFFRCLAGFFVGVIAARFHAVKPFAQSGPKASVIELAILLGSIAFVVYASGKAQFLVGPLLLVFVYVFASDGGSVSRFMSAPLFRYLAKISYSVYMVHVIVAIVVAIFAEQFIAKAMPNWNEGFWGGDLLLIPYLAAVIGVSHLTYHFVEIPGGRLVKKWLGKRRAAPQTRLEQPAE